MGICHFNTRCRNHFHFWILLHRSKGSWPGNFYWPVAADYDCPGKLHEFEKTSLTMENLDLIVLSGIVSLVFFGFSFTLLKTIWGQRKTKNRTEQSAALNDISDFEKPTLGAVPGILSQEWNPTDHIQADWQDLRSRRFYFPPPLRSLIWLMAFDELPGISSIVSSRSRTYNYPMEILPQCSCNSCCRYGLLASKTLFPNESSTGYAD